MLTSCTCTNGWDVDVDEYEDDAVGVDDDGVAVVSAAAGTRGPDVDAASGARREVVAVGTST